MSANPGNVCKHLEVLNDNPAYPFRDMMSLQIELQTRLNRLPEPELSYQEIANSVIYWRHCIASECDELLEWFNEENDTDLLELEMEAIDVIHFIFNIGIALSIDPDELQAMVDDLDDLPRTKGTVSVGVCRFAVLGLSSSLTRLIDLLPWKNWKAYGQFKPDHEAIRIAYAYVMTWTIHLGNCVGMNTTRMYNVYVAKNRENHRRQDVGY